MSNTVSILREMLGGEQCVSFKHFVTSVDFCDNQNIYDYWIKQEETIPESCSELILDGSLGGGKSTFAAYYFCYRVYKLFVNGSPQSQLGLPDNSDIYCFYFSVSMTMAKKSGFQLIYDIFKTCKWFKINAPINEELKSSVQFVDKHFHIDFASSEGHQIGLNVWAFILDEANFRSGVGRGTAEEYEEVTQLYQQLLDRQVSRFAKPDGSVDALAILVSSASYQSSFLEKRKLAVKGDDSAKVITTAAYEVKPERFSKEKFDVFIGAGVVEACIVESEQQKQKLLESAGVWGTGQEDTFIKSVPVNLKKQFEANIVLALQNHCGVPTLIQGSFMSNLKFLYEAYTTDIPNVFQSEYLTASTEDDTELIEYFIPGNVVDGYKPHSLFLDLSVAGDTGTLAAYRYDGKNEKGLDMHTRVFSLKLKPPQYPAQTSVRKVCQLVIDLAKHINIVAFGSDQYQSTGLRQQIQEELGLEDIRVSIDSSDIPHLHWQRGLVERRIKQTPDELLEREVKEAIHDWKRHRVLKSQKSSDDNMQANVGAFYLSDTFGKSAGTLDGLYGPRINIVGGKTMTDVLKKLGYRDM